MKIQKETEEQGYSDYIEGVPKNRNPFQYTSDIFKQAAWVTGWKKAESDKAKPKVDLTTEMKGYLK